MMKKIQYVSRGKSAKRNQQALLVIKLFFAFLALVGLVLLYSQANHLLFHEAESEQHHLTIKPIVVAYVISLIKCGDFQSSVVGMSDAAAVLRHSIHKHSVATASKYDYKMYAIVHRQAQECSGHLRDLGYEIVVRDTPFDLKKDVQPKEKQRAMKSAWCCGTDEFIKLYAYTLIDHPLVVHMDVDFLLTAPMDDVFDAMLLPSNFGKEARSRIPREFPQEPIPDSIEVAMTRDWPQVMPGRKPGFQAGFIVLKPSLQVFESLVDTIKTTEYVGGYSRRNGWGGKVSLVCGMVRCFLASFADKVLVGLTLDCYQGIRKLCRFGRHARSLGLLLRCRSTEYVDRTEPMSLQSHGNGCLVPRSSVLSTKTSQSGALSQQSRHLRRLSRHQVGSDLQHSLHTVSKTLELHR